MLLFALLLAAGPAKPLSQGRMAVLEFENRLKGADRDTVDRNYFSDEVRRAALELLPSLDLMTRENMQAMAKSNGLSLEQCDQSQCVEVGRTLGADTVVNGYLTRIGSTFVLVLSLHEAHEGRLLSSSKAEGKTVDELFQSTDPA